MIKERNMYLVTKNFLSGPLAGKSVTEKTVVPFKLGRTYTSCTNRKTRYTITNVEKIAKA